MRLQSKHSTLAQYPTVRRRLRRPGDHAFQSETPLVDSPAHFLEAQRKHPCHDDRLSDQPHYQHARAVPYLLCELFPSLPLGGFRVEFISHQTTLSS
jgi:hypothetical protein